MADKRDIFYRPDIKAPEREADKPPEEVREARERRLDDIDAVAERMGIPKEDLPESSFDLMAMRFDTLEMKAKELSKRAKFLLDKTIEDIDGYIGDAPPIILKYIEDMTGRSFSAAGVMKPKTDDIYTLDDCTMKCLFKAAEFYNPSKREMEIVAAVDGGADMVRQKIEEIRNSSYMDEVVYGFKLLIMVLKMSFVIMVHYTVGYICGWLRENTMIKTGLDIMSSFFGVPMIGTIVQKATQTIEKLLLSLVGFRCNKRGELPPICDSEIWNKVDFKRVNCCTTEPIFFGEGPEGRFTFDMDKCFERWIKEQMDPTGSGARAPCNRENCSDPTMEFTPEEEAKSKEICRYLMENPSRHGVMSTSDIYPLSRAIEASESGIVMSQQGRSALDTSKRYMFTGRKEAPWDCFGVSLEGGSDRKTELFGNVNAAAGRWTSEGTDKTIVAKSIFALEYLQVLDNAITKALELADKTVISTINLSKWGASRQLCCYVYLIVLISTLIQTLIEKGTVCPDMDIGESIKNEFRWARDFGGIATVAKFLHILRVIQQIIDIFRNRLNRAVFLAGIKLPLREMWEMIKATLSNGIAQFLDILLGPIDQVLAGIRTIPEVKHMLNNECFAIDKVFSFILCLLGNLKWGITNWIMQFLDFSLNDFTLINDIYLSRTKLAFLDALSKLLGLMINLILGIRDCYDPSDLTNQIVEQQLRDQYYSTVGYMEVMKTTDAVTYADECSRSIMNQQFIPSQEVQDELAAMDGGLTRNLTELGLVEFPEKIMKDTLGIDGAVIDLQNFIDPSSLVSPEQGLRPVGYGDFVKRMEELTGVQTTEIKESLRNIFDILRGQSEGQQ
jgi:hypothetical protein